MKGLEINAKEDSSRSFALDSAHDGIREYANEVKMSVEFGNKGVVSPVLRARES